MASPAAPWLGNPTNELLSTTAGGTNYFTMILTLESKSAVGVRAYVDGAPDLHVPVFHITPERMANGCVDMSLVKAAVILFTSVVIEYYAYLHCHLQIASPGADAQAKFAHFFGYSAGLIEYLSKRNLAGAGNGAAMDALDDTLINIAAFRRLLGEVVAPSDMVDWIRVAVSATHGLHSTERFLINIDLRNDSLYAQDIRRYVRYVLSVIATFIAISLGATKYYVIIKVSSDSATPIQDIIDAPVDLVMGLGNEGSIPHYSQGSHTIDQGWNSRSSH